MRALFLRELRRQLPYALGPLLLVFLAPLLHEALSNATWSTLRELLRAEVAFAFLAGLVGVGAVAPERGSGAHAFLRRLPLALSRAFAVRAGAALGFLALGSCALALEVAVTGASLHPVVFAAPGAFALGLLASVVSERPLAALGITIPLSGVLIVAYFGPLLALGVRPPSAGSAAVLATVPALLTFAAAAIAFVRGRVHLSGPRTAGVGISALVAFSLLGAAGTGFARSAQQAHVVPSLTPILAYGRGDTTLLTLAGTRWYGRELRVLVLRPGRPALAIPFAGARAPQLSPDGRYVLVRGEFGWDQRGGVFDCETGAFQRVDLGSREVGDVLWREGRPILVSLTTSRDLRLEAALPPGEPRRGLTLRLPSDVRSLAVDDLGRTFLLGQHGLSRVDGLGALELEELEAGVKTRSVPLPDPALALDPTPAPPDLRGLRVSPGGELLVLDRGIAGLELWEVDGGRRHALPDFRPRNGSWASRPEHWFDPRVKQELSLSVDPRRALGTYRLDFSLDGRGLALEHRYGGALIWRGGESRVLDQHPVSFGVPSWEPGGERVLFSSGHLWRTDDPGVDPRWLDLAPFAWLGKGRLVSAPRDPEAKARALSAFDLETSAQSALGGVQ